MPPSWTIDRTAQEVGVSPFLVKKSLSLKYDKGILADQKNVGHGLHSDRIKSVESYYQDDKFSRQCLGQKNYSSRSHLPTRIDSCAEKDFVS